MNKRLSNIAKERADWNFCRFGDAQQGFDGNYFFAALNFANVFGIQVSQFGQFFLRKAGTLAIKTNRVADNSAVSQDWFSSFLRGWHNLKD